MKKILLTCLFSITAAVNVASADIYREAENSARERFNSIFQKTNKHLYHWGCSKGLHAYFYENELETLPEDLMDEERIRLADFGSNKLTTLPENISQWTDLRVIDLSYNQLKSFPDILLDLPNLKFISLEGNPIQEFSVRLAKGIQESKYNIISEGSMATQDSKLNIYFDEATYNRFQEAMESKADL